MARKKEIKYVIFDYIFTPDDKIRIEYKGPDPIGKVYSKLSKNLQIIFHGRGKNVFEDQFKWDITDSPPTFYTAYRLSDAKFDRFTKYEVRIKIFGAQPKDLNDPNGLLYMEIKPVIITTYKFGNVFEKAMALPFIWLYHLLIYNNVRRSE